MQRYLPDIFTLLVAVAGWFYLFYSRAAQKLEGLEENRLNRRRVGLRRAGGAVMLLLAIGFFAGLNSIEPRGNPRAFVLIWGGVMVLLAAMVGLALIDVRLTARLRQAHKHRLGQIMRKNR